MKNFTVFLKWFIYSVLVIAIVPAVVMVASQSHFPESYRGEEIVEVIPFPEVPAEQVQEIVETDEEIVLAQNELPRESNDAAQIERSQVRLADASQPEETADKNELPLAPDFTLKDVDGNEFTLSENLGKLTILNFFATWCGPCKREIPDFVDLYEKYNEQGLEIIGVSVDRGRSVSRVKPMYDQYKMNYPVLMEGTSVGMMYGGVSSIPTTFIINEEGRVLGRIMGLRPHAFFEQVIKEEMLGK